MILLIQFDIIFNYTILFRSILIYLILIKKNLHIFMIEINLRLSVVLILKSVVKFNWNLRLVESNERILNINMIEINLRLSVGLILKSIVKFDWNLMLLIQFDWNLMLLVQFDWNLWLVERNERILNINMIEINLIFSVVLILKSVVKFNWNLRLVKSNERIFNIIMIEINLRLVVYRMIK